MIHDHEYSLLGGVNRALIGRYLTLLASAISGIAVFLLLSAEDLAKKYDLPVNLPPTALSLIGAGIVFALLYALFNKTVWKWRWAVKYLKVPDLSGEWQCTGVSADQHEQRRAWHGEQHAPAEDLFTVERGHQ